ncbi:MAG: YncE family protein [Clostridiales bacterium]|nr:YncE family protein [Clostridiales bacterium]
MKKVYLSIVILAIVALFVVTTSCEKNSDTEMQTIVTKNYNEDISEELIVKSKNATRELSDKTSLDQIRNEDIATTNTRSAEDGSPNSLHVGDTECRQSAVTGEESENGVNTDNPLINNPLLNNFKGQLTTHVLNIGLINSPKGAAFSLDGTEIWVTSLMNSRSGVCVFNTESGERLKKIYLSGYGGVEVIFSEDGNYAYISQMETGKIFEIDANTKEVSRVLNTGSVWTKVMDISADGKTLFASNWSGRDVSEIDLETGKLRRKIPVVRTPRGIYATEDGKTLYVAGFHRGEIQKIDLLTGDKVVIFKSGGAMRHIVADEERGLLFVSDMGRNKIMKVDMLTDEVTTFASTDANPNTIALTPDKRILIASCRGRNSPTSYYRPGPEWGSVLLFDTVTGNMLDAIVAGNQPTALDISADGSLLVFSDFLDARLKVYSIPSYEILIEGSGGRANYYKNELRK